MSDELPILRDGASLKAYWRKTVCVIGRYEQVDVRMAAKGLPPQFLGHAALVLGDGKHVMLGFTRDPESRRPAEEIALYEGKLAAVTGVLCPTASPGYSGLAWPAVSSVLSIRLAD